MKTKRIEYIDALRGLCIFWVVWYHSTHPEWVSYPFRLPTLFFVSGMFFKEYSWNIFWRKKVNMYIIPLLFFYLLYYAFLLAINYGKLHYIPTDIRNTIFDLFRLYSGNAGFTCNYPLWFMIALLNIQLLLYAIKKYIINKYSILGISAVITLIGYFIIWRIPTPLFLGKSLTFFIYYVLGHLYGKKYISLIENKNNRLPSFISLIILIISIHILKGKCSIDFIEGLLMYCEFIFTPLILIIIFSTIQNLKITNILKFLGKHSLIIFGLHDLYLSVLRIFIGSFVNEMNVYLGFFIVIIAILLMWPSIICLNKFVPKLVGKKPVLCIE